MTIRQKLIFLLNVQPHIQLHSSGRECINIDSKDTEEESRRMEITTPEV